MKLEDLNKTQIVLLTLLVSFVTSIATGIVTLSLMDQAPPGVSQTINRVVERTVERVVPEVGSSVVTKETTVVVKEDDQVTKAIENGSRGTVLIRMKDEPETSLAIGLLVSPEGLVATDGYAVPGSISNLSVLTSDNKKYDLSRVSKSKDGDVEIFSILVPKGEKLNILAVPLGDSQSLRLGQSVIALSLVDQRRVVGTGIVSSLFESPSTSTTTPVVISSIEASVAPSGTLSGSPLLNLFGDVVGINQVVGGRNKYLPINFVKNALIKPGS